MTYSELKDCAEAKKISLKSIADMLNMSSRGMQQAFENQTLSIKKVVSLCELLQITPNDFFGWKSSVVAQQIQTGCVGNAQYMDTRALDLLQEQLSIKDKQLCEAQGQISRLIGLLGK